MYNLKCVSRIPCFGYTGFMRFLSLFVLLCATLLPARAFAADFSTTVRGRILLDVEHSGEAWYVYPPTFTRSFLGRPDDAYNIMRGLGLGITDADLARIPPSDSSTTGDLTLRRRLSGRILLQVQQHGEAWYVHPVDLRRYYLGRPADAFALMSALGLGISAADLARIPINPDSIKPAVNETHSFRSFTLTNAAGSFPIRVISLKKNSFDLLTDTAETGDCASNCAALSLKDFVERNNATIGIHGTYFCPPDYPACEGKVNTFLPPVMHSALGTLLNENGLRFFNRPLVTVAQDGRFSFFHRASALGSTLQDVETATGGPLRAVIGNWPSLVENGVSVAAGEPSEPGFLVAGTRGGIGWNSDTVFLVVASNATMEQFASIFVTLGAQFAMNLDGGGSVALFEDGAYRVGPGRLLPNAIIFRAK